MAGNLLVRSQVTRWYLEQRLPNLELEVRTAEIELDLLRIVSLLPKYPLDIGTGELVVIL